MIVVGGSFGAMDALCEILRDLPPGFPLPIVVVLHRHRDSVGLMQPIIQRSSLLPVVETEDKNAIEPGRVYLGPPDYHLLIDEGCLSLSTDEPVSFARPSIDVLLESAAEVAGGRTIAVILSGGGSDGSQGAKLVAQRGGTVIVQEPATSPAPWMPAATISAVPSCRVLPLSKIAPELRRIAGGI